LLYINQLCISGRAQTPDTDEGVKVLLKSLILEKKKKRAKQIKRFKKTKEKER